MSKVIAVRHDGDGNLESFKLDDGRVLNRDQICAGADKGHIYGVSLFTTRDGGQAVRSDRGLEGYSLDSLPEF